MQIIIILKVNVILVTLTFYCSYNILQELISGELPCDEYKNGEFLAMNTQYV